MLSEYSPYNEYGPDGQSVPSIGPDGHRFRRAVCLCQCIVTLLCLAVWEILIWMKLEEKLPAWSWPILFIPAFIGYGIGMITRGSFLLSSLYQLSHGLVNTSSVHFNKRIFEDMLETSSAAAHLVAVVSIAPRLEKNELGSLRQMFIPFFVGMLMAIVIGYYGTARMAAVAPHVPREHRKLGYHKLLVEYINVSLATQKFDGTLRWPWSGVFLFQWVQAGCFTLVTLLVLFEIIKRLSAWRANRRNERYRVQLAALISLETSMAGVITCTTLFYVQLCRRLDGAPGVDIGDVMAPLALHNLFVVAWCVVELVLLVKHSILQVELTAFERLGPSFEEGRQVTLEFETDEHGLCLVRHAPTYFAPLEAEPPSEAVAEQQAEPASEAPTQSEAPDEVLCRSRASLDDDALCKLCHESVCQCVLLPCGHGGVCRDCVQRVVSDRDPTKRACPWCRRPIARVALVEAAGSANTGEPLFRVTHSSQTLIADEDAGSSQPPSAGDSPV